MKSLYLYSALVASLCFLSCKKDSDTSRGLNLASVSTNAVSSITHSTASSGGNITDDGGSSVTARGVCWSTSVNPALAGDHTVDGAGTGSFSSVLSGLSANQTYYIRAYAVNSSGTAYGNELTFTTPSPAVYVGGYEMSGIPVQRKPTVWKDGISSTLTIPGGSLNGSFIRALHIEGNDVYATGSDHSSAGMPRAIYWKNGTPTLLTNGSNEATGTSIAIKNGDVYIAGSDNGPSFSKIKLWVNSTVQTLQTQPDSYGSACQIAISGPDVYVLTRESDINANTKSLLWKNGVMQTDLQDFAALSLAVSGTDVYLGGLNMGVPVTWKNGLFSPLPVPSTSTGIEVLSIYIDTNGDVYACGILRNGSSSTAMAWKNGTAIPLTGASSNGSAFSIFIYGNDMYVAGHETISGIVYAVLWVNGARTILGEGQAFSVVVK